MVLVALRVWYDLWAPRKVILTLKSDNKAALTIAARMKTAKNANLIGREVAYLYTTAAYHPRYITHLPGVANQMADSLSRLNDPSKDHFVPEALAGVEQTVVPLRSRSYYKTLAAKAGGKKWPNKPPYERW